MRPVMLIEFQVMNYRSFRDHQVLSMVAGRFTEHTDTNTVAAEKQLTTRIDPEGCPLNRLILTWTTQPWHRVCQCCPSGARFSDYRRRRESAHPSCFIGYPL
jgi:hypothetical protein